MVLSYNRKKKDLKAGSPLFNGAAAGSQANVFLHGVMICVHSCFKRFLDLTLFPFLCGVPSREDCATTSCGIFLAGRNNQAVCGQGTTSTKAQVAPGKRTINQSLRLLWLPNYGLIDKKSDSVPSGTKSNNHASSKRNCLRQ